MADDIRHYDHVKASDESSIPLDEAFKMIESERKSKQKGAYQVSQRPNLDTYRNNGKNASFPGRKAALKDMSSCVAHELEVERKILNGRNHSPQRLSGDDEMTKVS